MNEPNWEEMIDDVDGDASETPGVRPCPFCDSANVGLGHGENPFGLKIHFVICFDCDTEGPVTMREATAIVRWNDRPNESRLTNELEVFRKTLADNEETLISLTVENERNKCDHVRYVGDLTKRDAEIARLREALAAFGDASNWDINYYAEDDWCYVWIGLEEKCVPTFYARHFADKPRNVYLSELAALLGETEEGGAA